MDDATPTIGISLNIELPGKKVLVLQSLVERDANNLDSVLDKLRKAGERQHAVGMIDVAKRQLEVETKMLEDHVQRMAQVEQNHNDRWVASNRKGRMTLSENEQKALAQAHGLVEESKRRIEMCKKDLGEYQRVAGV